jgi:hypothetical protein
MPVRARKVISSKYAKAYFSYEGRLFRCHSTCDLKHLSAPQSPRASSDPMQTVTDGEPVDRSWYQTSCASAVGTVAAETPYESVDEP